MNDNQNNTNTADNANATADAGNTNTNKKSKFRRFGGYALKGAVVAAVGAGIYYGARALLGNAGGEAVDAVASMA